MDIFRSRENLFFSLYYTFVFMMIIIFFITPNPYSALHSGKAGFEYHTISEGFFIAPTYLILFSLLMVSVYGKKILLDYKILIALGILLMSGIYTQRLLTDTVSYIYNFLSFLLVSSLATITFFTSKNIELQYLKRIAKFLTIILFLGLFLALLFPNRFGVLPFGFSRVSRGEITLWNTTGVFVIYPTIAILAYRKYKTSIYIVLSLIMTLVILSTATRAHVILTLLPFLILIIFNIKYVYKLLFIFLFIPTLIFFLKPINSFFIGGNTNDITNGRFDLWKYHWGYIKENPLLGSGSSFQEIKGDYTGIAGSEIGALMWFSEAGMLFGLILLFIVLKAAFVSIKLLLKGKELTDTELFFSIIMLSMLPNLVQSYGRILNLDDLIFWFSVFYLNAYYKPLFQYFEFGLKAKPSKLRKSFILKQKK